MIREEVVLLFHTQRILGNPFATEVFEQKYTEILCRQRFIISGPGPNSPYASHKRRFGGIYCPLEPQRERCPDAAPLAERFRFLCMVNAPYSIPPHTQPIAKTEEQKQQIRAIVTKNPTQLYVATNNVLNLDSKAPLTLYFDGIPYPAAYINNWIIPRELDNPPRPQIAFCTFQEISGRTGYSAQTLGRPFASLRLYS